MVQRNLTPGGDKNGADINLALDALEMAFTRNHINAFVIVGGDSDFMHVGTRMLHFNFLPCFPLGTVVVVEKGVVGEKTVLKTRFSTRSVAYAFVRLALLWGALVMLMVGVVAFDLQKVARAPNAPFWAQSLAYWMLGLSAVSLLAWWFSHRWTYASYQRAIQWADLIGLDRAIVDDNFRRRGMAGLPAPRCGLTPNWIWL